ncbi:hypothetical protein MKX01_041301 [Papaver californicum]|nr:hypothetical protein MKX01_041301 [Papaver californicum]
MEICKIQGRDKRGHKILRIIGKFLPARELSTESLKKYLEEKIFPKLGERRFSVVYFHTDVQRSDNFLGISTLRSIYEALPINIKENLEAVCFVHPGLQSKIFLATFGCFLFSGGLSVDHIRRQEIEIPDFVYNHDETLEYRPMMDYGMGSDHPRVYGAPMESPTPYSMRCIS